MRLASKIGLLVILVAACGDGGGTDDGATSSTDGASEAVCDDTLSALRASAHMANGKQFRLLARSMTWKEANAACPTLSKDDGFRLATAAEALLASPLFTTKAAFPKERDSSDEVLRPSTGFSLQSRVCHVDLWVADSPLAYKSLNKVTTDALVVSDETRLEALCVKP